MAAMGRPRGNRRSARGSPPAARNSCGHCAGPCARNLVRTTPPTINLSIVTITFRLGNGVNRPAEIRKRAKLAPEAHRSGDVKKEVDELKAATVGIMNLNLRNEPMMSTGMFLLARGIGSTKLMADNGTVTANCTTNDTGENADAATTYGNIIVLITIFIVLHRATLKAQAASKYSGCNTDIRKSAAEASSSRD